MPISSRRAFLTTGALLAAPVVVAPAAAHAASPDEATRLNRLQDEAALRELQRAWLRRFNTGRSGAALPDKAVRQVTTDDSGDRDQIEVARGGTSAVGVFACVAEMVTEIPRTSTLAQMAHAQGTGFRRQTVRGRLRIEYARGRQGWTVERARFVPAP